LRLRASALQEDTEVNLNAVTDDSLDVGVPHSDLLRELTETTIRREWEALTEVREKAVSAMGLQETTDALTVAAAFNGITRVADSTGIPLDDATDAVTADMREETGIQEFHYAVKSQKYD